MAYPAGAVDETARDKSVYVSHNSELYAAVLHQQVQRVLQVADRRRRNVNSTLSGVGVKVRHNVNMLSSLVA